MQETSVISEFFLTDVLPTPVLDRSGKEIGYLTDLIIPAKGEVFPTITALEINHEDKKQIIARSLVNLFSRRAIALSEPLHRIHFRETQAADLFLVKDFFDKQILDIHGAKVVRINDLKVAELEGDLHLVGVDVGLSGLLRRLKLERFFNWILRFFGKRLHEHLIPWNFVEPISGTNPKIKLTVPQSKINQLHPADIAEILTDLTPQERTAVMESLDEETAADALHDVSPELGLKILEDLPADRVAAILDEMNPDDAADILTELPEDQVQAILSRINVQEAAELSKLLTHHDEATAGGLMTPEFLSFRQTMTVDETINRLRELSPDVESVFYLYVVDEDERLVGVLTLRQLIIAKPSVPLKEIMTQKIMKVHAKATKDEVTELTAKYDLLALPVVDDEDRLLGIVTVDDVVDIMKKRGG